MLQCDLQVYVIDVH